MDGLKKVRAIFLYWKKTEIWVQGLKKVYFFGFWLVLWEHWTVLVSQKKSVSDEKNPPFFLKPSMDFF